MMKRLICWWRGHVINATITADYRYLYFCDRCNRLLPGPRP